MLIWATLLTMPTANALPTGAEEWMTVGESPVKVQCTDIAGKPWCRSVGVVGADSATIASTLEYFHKHVDKFDSVIEINQLEKGLLHVVLDYPYPVYDRDYVARYTTRAEGAVTFVTWESEEHPAAPETSNRVRLPRMAGEWRIEDASEGGSRVQYTWQAEIGGSFPSMTLNRARNIAGQKVLKDLSKALDVGLQKSK